MIETVAPEPTIPARSVGRRRRIDDGASVTGRMPQLLAAMRAGEVESYGSRRVLTVVDPLDDDAARGVDALLAERLVEAPETAWQAGNLAQRVRRLVEKVDPGGQTERARRARAERRVELMPGEHVMSSFEAHLPAEVAGACYTRVDGMARSRRRPGTATTTTSTPGPRLAVAGRRRLPTADHAADGTTSSKTIPAGVSGTTRPTG
ncbi:protein of unknown function (DUF222) [Prauserella aidingensis]|uniref:DUF222 domain-containing protein n=1 Tax=Prauserella aidingensis TaxID=387890 RepID=UPI0020A5E378|nr:DUF222 domain-containing protein [Prauserella aidingensis]MCP2252286.1 protein of unknown function (DUF222) [Prauserella aidingensis]